MTIYEMSIHDKHFLHTLVERNCMIKVFVVWNCMASNFGVWRSTRDINFFVDEIFRYR